MIDPSVVVVPFASDPPPAAHQVQPEFWRVPVEVVLACSSSLLRQYVHDRAMQRDWYKPTALVFARGDRFFATVEFHAAGKPNVLLPLDVWTLENRP